MRTDCKPIRWFNNDTGWGLNNKSLNQNVFTNFRCEKPKLYNPLSLKETCYQYLLKCGLFSKLETLPLPEDLKTEISKHAVKNSRF